MARTDLLSDAVAAVRRFGLGPRPGDLRAIAADPRAFVAEQVGSARDGGLKIVMPSSSELWRDAVEYQLSRRMQQGPARPGAPAPGVPPPPPAAMPQGAGDMAVPGMAPAGRPGANGRPGLAAIPNPLARAYAEDVAARAAHAVSTDAPFVERLVMFWSNLFCVSADKSGPVRATAGAYEREAIRPFVLGRFADMLKASTQHPAMLAYLDNDKSFGPNSVRGRRRGVGLNENLAREVLELHTLGVDGGYTQADVTELARMITGWRMAGVYDPAPYGTFFFDERAHEPGAFKLLGKTYLPNGVAQGEAALADLAEHPSTARYVARKLAVHFVSDEPAPNLVAKLEKTFRDTGGDLRAVSLALVTADEAWAPPPAKFLPPYDFRIAAHRLLGRTPNPLEFIRQNADFGQGVWLPPSPKGFPDGDADWVAPDALLERLDWASAIARAEAGTRDVTALAEDALGPAARDTLAAVRRAESRVQGLALLLTSSEFQTR